MGSGTHKRTNQFTIHTLCFTTKRPTVLTKRGQPKPTATQCFHSPQFVCCREFQTEYLLCDCNILWMHRWVKERNITVRDTRCVYPKSLQAQPVTGVKQELLTCGKGETELRSVYPVLICYHVFLTDSEVLLTESRHS